MKASPPTGTPTKTGEDNETQGKGSKFCGKSVAALQNILHFCRFTCNPAGPKSLLRRSIAARQRSLYPSWLKCYPNHLSPSGVVKFLILRACFVACRVNLFYAHLIARTAFSLLIVPQVPFRRANDDLLQGITTDEQHTLASMASRRGGIELKNLTWTHRRAFISSYFTYAASAASFWDERWAWRTFHAAFELRGPSGQFRFSCWF